MDTVEGRAEARPVVAERPASTFPAPVPSSPAAPGGAAASRHPVPRARTWIEGRTATRRVVVAGVLVMVSVLLGIRPLSARGAPPPGEGRPTWFGLTNLVDLELEISGPTWDHMSSSGGPAERRFGGGMRGTSRSAAPGFLEGLVRWFFGMDPAPPPDPPASAAIPEGIEGRSRTGYPWGTCRVRCAGEQLTQVAIRFKGASSMVRAPNAYKRPFKLDFGRGSPGRRFLGAEEVYLGNNVNDPTQMREALAYELFRRAGVPAPRTGFARVTLTIPGRIQSRVLGLYTLVESVGAEFEDAWLGGRGGLWMKPERMSGISYLGEEWAAYRERYRPDEPSVGLPPEQSARVIGFARWIRGARPESFARELAGWVDPDALLKFVALNAILANVDSFLGNGHNYYLHLQPRTGRLTFIPWDLNEAFGGHPVSGPSGLQMRFSVLRPNGDPNLLVEKLVADPQLGPRYRATCSALLSHVFAPERLSMDLDRIAAVTAPVVAAESRRARMDYEWTVLGQGSPPDGGRSTQPRFDREWAGDGYRPWGFPPGVEIDHLPLKQWIAGRAVHVRDELAGRAQGEWPRPRL